MTAHHDLTDPELRCLLSALIGTFPTVTHVRQEPSPADPGVGGELFRVEG